MVDKGIIFVLGAQDPEMREIAAVLRRGQRRVAHAARAGVPVSSRTAYCADGVVQRTRGRRATADLLPPQAPTAMVECGLRSQEPVLRIDHHHPGDPGYEMPPERYLEGSSLGQTLRLLEIEPNATQKLLAAADHCLTAAYQGACPGIDPRELLFLRASWRARLSGRGLSDVIDGVLDAAKQVRHHYDSELQESLFLDPTTLPSDLAEGGAYAGKAVRYRAFFPDGALKEMLKGATPAHVERFMDEHRARGRQVYGNPHRGYAGTYLL